jgi:hypothetical protein
MAIQKKSLIANREATKKALTAKSLVAKKLEAPRRASPASRASRPD